MIGWLEILVILIFVLILFGPNRLPELARAFGKAVKEFKNAMKEEPKTKKLKG